MRAIAFLLGVITLGSAMAAPTPKSTPREALKPFNEIVGPWRAAGEPATGTVQDKQRGFWRESIDCVWKFKGEDVTIVMSIKNGKHFSEAEIRYLPEKDQYQVTMKPIGGAAPRVFLGTMDERKRTLTADRVDDQAKEDQRVTINLVGEIRFIYRYDTKPSNRKLYSQEWFVAATKEGEALGTVEKKPECVVSGGLGTSTVSFKGTTYYVCCSGCRDAFNENPEKYVKEFLEKKAKEKK